MAFTANKVEMWTGEINDRIGGLAAVLEPLAEAGVDLEVVVARRQPGMPGKGVVFLGPIKGAKGEQAAAKAGMKKTPDLTALRVVRCCKQPAARPRVERDSGRGQDGVSADTLRRKPSL